MEDNKNKTKVDLMYDDLYEQGYLEKDRDTFNKFFYAPGEQGYKNRKALYDDLHEQGYLESPTYEDFARGIGLHAVQQSQPVVQAGTGPAAGGRQDLVESLNQYGEGLKAQSAPAAGNVANAADPSSRGGGAGRSWSDGENVVRRPGNVAVPYTGIKKTDPVTGEQYRVYTGAAAANADTVPSELQGRDLLDENGNLISARQWQSKYGDKPHLAGAAGLWNGGDLEYGTVLDSHIQKAIDLGMKHGDHSRMSTDELKAKRQELTDRYANGFTETPESLQDAIDLNNIDYELTARHLGYKSSDDMMKNHRGEADFELNKGRLNQDDLDFYEKQGSHVHNLGDNPLYVYGWQKFTDLAKRNEELGQSMSVEDYINALMADPDIESKFYAWTLTRAKKNNRSWASNINEAMDDFRKAISRGENPWEYAPEEKDVMAEFYGGELDRMDAEYEKELEAWQKRYDAWSANRSGLGWSHAPLGSYAAETGDNALGMIHTAQNLSKDARSVIDEAMKTGRGFSLSGEVGASVRGFRDSALDWRTWTFGITDLEDSKNMYNVAKKWKDGGQLNKAEQMLLDQMVLKAASDAFFNDYLSTGYEAGKTTGYALEFIAEMLTGAGAATDVAVRAMGSGLKKLGKKKVVQLLERIGMKGIVDGTLKKLGRATAKFGENKVGKVISKAIDKGTKLADEVVSVSNKGIGQTLGPGIAKVGAQTFENATGQAQGKFNPNTGRMEATSDSFADGMDFIESTKKAVKSQFGENASEFLGDSLLEPGIKWVNKFYRGATDKAFKKFGMKEAREFLDSLKGNDWYRFVQDFRKQVHYNGSFGEYCEEVANNIYDAAFVGDQNFNSPDDPNSVFNFKKNFRTYVSCKYMSLAFGAANVAGYRTPKYRANQDVKYADQIAKRAFVGEDWGSISSIIRDGSDEQVEQLMVDIAQSKKYNARQRQAAINYAGAVAAQKGIEAGDVKVERSAGDQEAREAYGRGYNMENLESLSAASGEYNRLRAEMERDYGAELMKRMDDEPGLVYNWVRAGAVSEEDAQKVLNYLNAKMAYDGAMDRLNDDDAAAKAAAEAHIDERVHTEDNGGDGQIHPVALKGRDGDFFVVSGNVASDEDGNVDVNASDHDIVVVDKDGRRIMTHAKDIAQVGDTIDPDAAKAQAVAKLDNVSEEVSGESKENLEDTESTESFEDTGLEDTDTTTGTGAAQGALPVSEYNQDDLVTVEVDGKQVTGIVTNGLDSDGNVTIYFDEPINGRQNWQMTPEQLNQVAVSYTSRDGETIDRSVREEESGESGENNGSDEVQDETPQQEEQPRYAVNPESLQGNEGDNFLNNTAAYLNGDMSAEDYLKSQGWDLDGYTPEQIKREADYQAQWAMPHLVEEQPAAPASEEVSGEPSDGEAIAQGTQSQVPTSGEYSVQSEEAASPSGATQQAPAQEQPQQAPTQPSLPIGEDGNADFSNATPQEAHDYIYNDPELDEDEANQAVTNKLKGAQNRLDQAQAVLDKVQAIPAPNMEDYGEDTAGYKRAKRERNEAIAQAQAAVDAAQREVDLWNGVQAQHMMDRATAAAANRAEERGQSVENPAAPSAPAPVSGESENNAPTPSQATPPQGQQTTESTQEPSAPQPNEGNAPVASTTPSSEEERGESAPVNETAGAAEEELTPDERIERARMEALENRAEELAESCGLPVQVARSLDDLSDRHRREVEKQHAAGKYVNGFYDPMTKQIVLFLPDIAKNGGLRRLERTFLHEGVAHGGLRALFENAQNGIQTFDELCDQVWEMMPVVTQAQMMNYIGVQKPEDMTQEKKRIAADEYMAHLAEWGVEQSVKSRIISAVKNALRKIGVKMKLSNNDIVSLLAASRRKLNEMDKVGINSAISEALDNDGEDEGEGVRMSTTAIFEGAGLEVSRDATDNEGKPTKEPLTDSKGNLVARIGDKEFSVDNPVKAEDLKPAKMGHAVKESSVLHMLIEDSKKYSGLSDAQADKIYQNYADLLNMYLYMGSAAMGGPETVTEAWEWLGDSVFRTIAANGDAQYSYSMDIIRVCKKNEAVIKAMSALQLREGRGATPSEIVELYRETHEDGYQVPCPVCYVFTRYIRNGKYASAAIKGMEKWGDHLPGGSDVWSVDQWVDALDKIQRETNPDYKPDGKNKMKGKELEKAKRFKKQLDQANKITVAYEKRVNALSYLLTTDDAIKAGTIKNKVLELTPERRASIEKELDIINEQYQHAVEIIAHQALSNWIKTHAIEEKDGKWTMREDAKKPEDIDDYKRNALDLRLTSNTIVNYPAIQRLRKSGGSAAGKEISFASDNRLGEVVSGLGINKTNLSGYKNKYEEALHATGRARTKARNEARKRFKDATVYALMQTLRGGQRMWSWSDNIERLSPDIAINIMQLQLLGGAMQTYSKQLEGIKLAAQMGAYVNGSLMAKDNGYQEVADKDVEERDGKLWLKHDITDEVEEYPVGGGEPKPRKRIVAAKGSYVYQAEDGKKYVLIYDDVVGVDPFGNELHGKGKKKGLFQLNQEYDRAGNILVGMNDLHVRAAMADPAVFFIIPWHSSGANNHILNQMLNILEQTMTDRLDYTAMQEEKNMLERNKNTKELPEVNKRLRDLWEEGRQWAKQNKWKSGMEVDSNGDVITESQYMYRQLRAQIFNGNIFEAMPSEEQYRAAVDIVNNMQATMDELDARNEAWKAKSPEYKKSPEGKAEKKAIDKVKGKAKNRYNPALHTIELHDGLIDWRDSSQHEGDAEWQEQHPKRINVEEARRMIEADEFLSQVLKRVEPIGHMTNGDNTYIYPYEYWQETDAKGKPADIKDADINGKRYVEYCRRMGYKPKFSGRWGDKVTEENMNDGNFVHDPGYWKLLIDRRMYDRNGKYQWLDPVTSENFEPDLVNPLKTGEEFNITQVADDKDAEDIAERVYNNMAERDGGVAKVDYSKPLEQIMDEYDAALAAGVQANVKLTDAEEDALDDMEEAMEEEDVDSGVLFSTSPTFYSNAERAVENIKQNKATAEQWKAMLTKAGGLKAGEDKWMGLSTWLDENKGKSLTKDEVLQFVRDNGIQMEEVNYGDIYETSGYVKLNDEYMALRNDAERIFQEANKQFADYVGEMEAKYGDDYYRQMTPQERQIYNRLSIDQELRDPNIYSNEDIAFREMVERYGDDFEMAFRATSAGLEIDDRDAASYFVQDVQAINFTRLDYTTEGLENKREIAFKVPNVEPYQEHDEVHFGPENEGRAVMWVRFGETKDADGKRVLVIDEIQSNRHQDAREKGYKVDEKTAFAEYKKAIVDYKEAAKRNDTEAMKDAEKRYNLYGAIAGQLPGGRESIPASVRDAVPAAPFEKNWHEVAMKRMLRLAAEEGFDKVAWTTGEQQAKRYSLGRAFNSIEREDNPNLRDTKRFVLSGSNMETVVVNNEGIVVGSTLTDAIGKDLSEVVGQSVAEKMMGLEDGDMLEGEDLRIGGEGMKGFYDQMLPRFMDKYGKRWGVKTGTVELPNVEEAGRTMHSVDVTPEMKESVMQGQPLFSVSNYSLGVPYQGTKGRIARSLMEKLPSGRRFVDLFAGGGAMTHAAMLSGKYDEYLMNDVNPVGVELFMQGVRGEWDDYNRTSMTPEEFKQIKGTPEAIPWSVLGLGRNLVKGGRPDYINRVKRLGQLKDQADKVSNSFEDYRNVEIRPGDVVYADIPYENTDTYNYGKGRKFDKKAFCDWAQAQDFPIFVSESVMPKGWVEIASESMKTINPKKNRVEKLWVQEKFAGEYEPAARNTEQEPEVDGVPAYEANNLRFSVLDPERDADLIADLDGQEYVTVYRTMAKVNGEYYPPMDSRDHDNPEKLRNPEKLGQYTQSEERPDLAYPEEYTDKKTGEKKTRWKFNLKKSNGKSVDGVAYNPYMHTSDSALNDQFSEAQDRDDLVVVECRVPVSELDPNSYHAEKALDPVGWKPWKAGPIVSKMTGKRNLLLSRWVKPVKELSWSEVADMVSKQLGDQFDVLPSNTFSKGLRAELEKRGYQFIETDNKGIIKEGLYKGVTWSDRYYDIHPELDKRSNKKAKRAKVAEVKRRNAEAVRFSTSAAVAALKDDERVYNDLLGKVFSGVSNETRRGIVEDAMRNRGNDFGAATEAWLGGLADDGKFADVDRRDWGRVKLALHQALMDNGVDVSEPLSDGESRYVLWKAGQVDDGVFSLAEDIVMQDRLLPGESGVRFSTSPAEQIYSDNFKNWFGDWENDPENASKVVDKDGRPLVVYNANAIAEEELGYGEEDIEPMQLPIRIFNREYAPRGFWFSNNNDFARKWIEDWMEFDPKRVSAVYLDIKNPLIIDAKHKLWKDIDGRNTNEWAQYAEENGYDGLIIRNVVEGDSEYTQTEVDDYVVFSPTQIKSATDNNGDFSRENPDIRFSVTPRDRAIARDQYERYMRNGRLQWVESMQDSMLGLKKLMQAIMGNNWTKIEDVAMYENPYIAENLMSSVTAAQQQAFYTEFMKPLLKEVSKLCKGGKKAREKAREDLTNYLMAKHGLERNQVLADRDAQETAQAGGDYQDAYAENRERDYSGLTALTGEDDVHAAEAKAQQMVDDYEAQHDTTALWSRINAATQVTLEKQYKSGMLSYAEYQRISDMFEYYVPLRGWEETTSDEVYGYLTSKAGPFLGGGIVKRAGGRTSKADDPIATIAQMGDDSIRTGNRNLMKQTFLNFVQNHPSDAVSVSDLWLQYDAVTDEWVPVFADIDPNDSADVVEQKIQDFEQRMQELVEQEPDKYKHGREAANIPYRVVPGMEKEHQVLVKRNGQTWVLTINGNPRAAQALNGLTNPDVPMEGAWASMIKGAEWVNRTLSALYTTLSPAFIVSNFLRDTGYSNTMVWVRESPNYALRFNKNYLKLNPGTLRWLLGKWEDGTLDESKPLQKHFKEFMLNGGETGFAMVKDLDKYKKDLLNEVKNMNSRNFVRKGMKVLGSQYELLGRSIENCARFAAYMTSREMGRSAERAAYDAKEISVNFNKKGSGGKSLGKVGQTKTGNVGAFVSGMARSLYTFWNAGVQGMTNAGRAVKRHPVKAALMGVGPLYAAGFLAPILAQLMGAGGDGDDDKNAYYNLPEYVRRSNLCIWLGDAWLTIPLPIEFRSIYGLGELTYGVISGNERYTDEELAMQVAGQFSQLLPIDMLEGGGGFHPFIPTLFKPIVEAEQNKSWSGLPIYRSSEWNKDDPEYTKAFSNANEWIVSGAEWLNAMTGGDEFKKGWIDLNPAKIEYMLKGYLGGIYTTIDEVRRAAETAFGKRDFEWRNIPLANRVIKQGDERTESKKLRDEYFKYKDDYENTKHLINKYKNAENTDLFDYAKKLDLLNNSKEYGRYLIFEKYATMLEAYQKAKKGASGEVLKKIEEDEKALMRQLVDEMHAFEDGKITVGNRPKLSKKDRSEDYGYMYNKLRTYVDINEDALLDSALKRAKAADDKGLVAALNSIKRSISEMKKGLGRGKDEEVMNSIRQMRNSVLQSFGIIGGGEEEPPEVEEQWQEEPQEDWGDEGNADFDEPIEPYPDDEDDEYDY